MLSGNVVRFNPSRKNERLNSLIVQVWQDKREFRAKRAERVDTKEERAQAFDYLESVTPSYDPEVLREAIARAEKTMSGGPMIAAVFKARKKLAMLEGDTLLQSVADSEDLEEIKKVLYELKGRPYVDPILQAELKRRVEITEAEKKLRDAVKSDNPETLRIAMYNPDLGTCRPGRDIELMNKARKRLASLVKTDREIDKAKDRIWRRPDGMRASRCGTGEGKDGAKESRSCPGSRAASKHLERADSRMSVATSVSVSYHGGSPKSYSLGESSKPGGAPRSGSLVSQLSSNHRPM